MDINPSSLHDTFEDGPNKDMWEFHPNGYLEENACERKGMMMVWGEKVPLKMITTCQMIIQEGHIMQFKVRELKIKLTKIYRDVFMQKQHCFVN